MLPSGSAHASPTNGAGTATTTPTAVVSLCELQAPDIGIADWECLFTAVCERLRPTFAEPIAGTDPTHDAAWVRASVRECSEALDQLRASLAQELGRCRRLDTEVLHLRAALAHTRAELVGRPGARDA